MIELLKNKLGGIGFVADIGSRNIFIEFENIESLYEDLLKVKSEKCYEIVFIPGKDGKLGINLITLDDSYFKSQFLVFKMENLKIIEVLTKDSEMYKYIVSARSKIIMPDKHPNLQKI